MSFLKKALQLAEFGFYVFPLVPGDKTPVDKGWQEIATRDPEKIKLWWWDSIMEWEQPYNIGISTSKFGIDKRPLLVVDIDNKDGKDGDGAILELELMGKDLPDTFTQTTPTGGRHLIYLAPYDISNSGGRVAPGIDTRGCGGLLVGAGSEVPSGTYGADFAELCDSPTWLVETLTRAKPRTTESTPPKVQVNAEYAELRAAKYLATAPVAISGMGGNHTTFRVAAYLKDLGVSSFAAYELMSEHWNDRCEPPWSDGELTKIIENAYAYSQEAGGVAAPEADFQPVIEAKPPSLVPESGACTTGPIDDLNKEYAFVIAGSGHIILRETTDEMGNFMLVTLKEETFHRKFAGRSLLTGDGKARPITKVWIESPNRRSYDGFCFRPGQTVSPRFYNLFRGFAVEPSREGDMAPVEQFIEHATTNVCQGDKELAKWLLGYFAHLVQRPWERPDVALVFRGLKGVGKNVLVESVGHLLGQHFGVAADQRYLSGNFNSHLENKLLYVLDEAFWSGEKNVSGILKHLVTGTKHNIERKGQEAYTVDNCLRVAIMGNEDWLVPASDDERRYAVFDVGSGRKQDRPYFRRMVQGLKAGGYSRLLAYLLDYDLTGIDVGEAPKTTGLLAQKEESLDPFHKWWLQCLHEEEILGSEFPVAEWPMKISKESFREAYHRYAKSLGARWVADDAKIGRFMHQLNPSTIPAKMSNDNGSRVNVYRLSSLAVARREWERYIGHLVSWNQEGAANG